MRKLLLTLLICIFTISIYSQDIETDSLFRITNYEEYCQKIMSTTYNYVDYKDNTKIEYYDQRIKNVLIKYYYIYENDYDTAIKVNWFRKQFIPTFNNEMNQRQIFIKNNTKE